MGPCILMTPMHLLRKNFPGAQAAHCSDVMSRKPAISESPHRRCSEKHKENKYLGNEKEISLFIERDIFLLNILKYYVHTTVVLELIFMSFVMIHVSGF